MDDDPWDWGVERVVRELCSQNRTWRLPAPSSNLPPRLKTLLREQDANGHVILTSDEEVLFEVLGMKTLNHKATFRSALGQFRRLSPKYNRLELQYADTPAHDDSPSAAAAAESPATDKPPSKRRRINSEAILVEEKQPKDIAPQSTTAPHEPTKRRVRPQLVSRDGINRKQQPAKPYFNQAGLSNYNISHHDADSPDDQVREFTFQSENIPVGHRIQVHRLLRRAAYQHRPGASPPFRRWNKQPSDVVVPLSDPFDDDVLPLYGESDEEYDSETWKEIQEEQEERKNRQPHGNSLTAQAIEDILDEVIQRYEAEWWEEKEDDLRHNALDTWRSLREGSHRQSLCKISEDLRHLDERIAALRRQTATCPWSTRIELVRGAANLRPSVRDRLRTRWLQDLANQKHEPSRAVTSPPRRTGKAASTSFEDHSTDTGEDLSSDSEGIVQTHRRNATSRAPKTRSAAEPIKLAPREVVYISSDDESDDDQSSPASPDGNAVPVDNMDDDADEEGHQDEIENLGGQFANRTISNENWTSLCHLFQCQENITEHRPVGFKLTISAYQLHAVWWMVTQFPIRGVPGGCLGDEMGLGKTIEVLASFVIFALIKANHAEVQDFWKKSRTIDGRTHLPQNQEKMMDSVCPSQRVSPYGLLCPCVKSGQTYLVATMLASLPTICFAPPSSIHGWRREFEKLIDAGHPIMQHLHFSILHNDFKGDKTYYHTSDRVGQTMAEATRYYVNQRNQPECHLEGRKGLSNWFLLVSSSGAPGLRKAYNGKRVRYKAEDDTYHEGKVFTTNGLAATFVFFDEAHTYRGSLSNKTQPFALLKTITEKSWDPTVAFAISGSISAGGPGQLTNIVDHILRVKGEQQEGRPSIGGVTNVTELEDKKVDWNYLLQKHHIVKTKDKVDKRKKSISELMENLVPHVLMARRNVDTFRGQTIGDAGREIVVQRVVCNMVNGAGRNAFCKLTANVQAYVRKAFDERHNAWKVDGTRGPEPTQHSVELEFFGGEGAAAMKLGKGRSGIWTQLLRANVYPEVARLYLDKLVPEEDLERNSINRHGDKACLLVATDAGQNDLQRQLASSPFWPYLPQLMEQSSKFAQLCQYVNDMVAYRDRRPVAIDDPGPADGTNIRHMVVLSDTPVSSYITFMLLCVKFPKVKVMLINGRTRKVATEKTPEYGRREMIEDLMSDCTSKSRNKIIVSTYRICGTALNMQRANYCVMLEPACDAKEEAQAAARVNRRGQCMRPVTVRLHDERNLPETLKRSRHQNQDKMENWQEQGIPWDDYL